MARKEDGYVLSPTARNHLREAKRWSLERWGKRLNETYFSDLDAAARRIAENYNSLPSRIDLTGDATLHAYPAREHFLIYVPLNCGQIAIVAVFRQGRDLPKILAQYRFTIEKELAALRKSRGLRPE